MVSVRHVFRNLDVLVEHHDFALNSSVVHAEVLVGGIFVEEQLDILVDLEFVEEIVGLELSVKAPLKFQRRRNVL